MNEDRELELLERTLADLCAGRITHEEAARRLATPWWWVGLELLGALVWAVGMVLGVVVVLAAFGLL
jgi:hypothetical protein